jgi:Flp pilus assembly protein TadG
MRMTRFGREQRGAAAVEMAVVLPIFVLVLAGVVQFGAAMYSYASMMHAAREGARYMAVDGWTSTATSAKVKSLVASWVPPSNITVTATLPAAGESDVSVEVQVPLGKAMLVNFLDIGSSYTLKTKVTMRKES